MGKNKGMFSFGDLFEENEESPEELCAHFLAMRTLLGEEGVFGQYDSCKSREDEKRPTKKVPEHILADAMVKGVRANGEAVSKHLFSSIQESYAECIELTKEIEALKKVLREQSDVYEEELQKQREVYDKELQNQRKDYKDAMINFQNESATLSRKVETMQKSIEDKEAVLRRQAAEIDQSKKVVQSIVDLTNDLKVKSQGEEGVTTDIAKLLESVSKVLGAT